MPRLYKGSELKYNTGVKVPDGTIKDIRLTFYTDDKASFVKTYSKDEIEVIDGCLSCSIDKKDTLLLNEGVLNCKMESSVVRDDFSDTYDTVFSFNTSYYLKDTLNPVEIKYQEKTITNNGTYTADDGYVALSKVDVAIPSSLDITQPFVNLNYRDFTVEALNKLTGYENLTSLNTKFRGMRAILPSKIEDVTYTFDFSNVENADFFLYELSGGNLNYKFNLNFTEDSFKKCTSARYFMGAISNCMSVNTELMLDFSNVKDCSSAFGRCFIEFNPVKVIITDKCINMSSFGYKSNCVFDFSNFDVSNVINFGYFLAYHNNIKDIPLLDFSNAVDINNAFMSMSNLTNLGGFKNLGKGFTSTNKGMTLNLRTSSKLTTESILNIFNNLYPVESS